MNKNELLRRLPKIDEVLKEESLVVLAEEKGSCLLLKLCAESSRNEEHILRMRRLCDETGSGSFDILSQFELSVAEERMQDSQRTRS